MGFQSKGDQRQRRDRDVRFRTGPAERGTAAGLQRRRVSATCQVRLCTTLVLIPIFVRDSHESWLLSGIVGCWGGLSNRCRRMSRLWHLRCSRPGRSSDSLCEVLGAGPGLMPRPLGTRRWLPRTRPSVSPFKCVAGLTVSVARPEGRQQGPLPPGIPCPAGWAHPLLRI